jgi:hypothetical protein
MPFSAHFQLIGLNEAMWKLWRATPFGKAHTHQFLEKPNFPEFWENAHLDA